VLELNANASVVKHSVVLNHDESDIQRYKDYYVNQCPWRTELQQLPNGQLYSTFTDFSCDQASFYKTEFYNDWAKSQDIAHGLCGTIYKDNESVVQLMFQRTHGQGYFKPEEKQAINQLVPYIQKSFELKRLFNQLNMKQSIFESQHFGSSSSFITFSMSGKVQYYSTSAEQIIQSFSPIIRMKQDRLSFNSLKEQRQWEHFFSNSEGIKKVGIMSVVNQGGTELQLKLTHIPDNIKSMGFLKESQPQVLVQLFSKSKIKLDPRYLKELYQLTPKELDVIEELVAGKSIKEIATIKHSSEHTVRTHTKNILRKTQFSSQNQLVSAFLSNPVFHIN
jgi:DNA-binding CsgD family transcriptional regulator